jgi:hypothetical protein
MALSKAPRTANVVPTPKNLVLVLDNFEPPVVLNN